jgi:hypothetical protein
VTAPTLLIAGGRDEVVLDLNRRAQTELRCENDLAVVLAATRLFQEPGTRPRPLGWPGNGSSARYAIARLRASPSPRGRLRHRGDQHPAGYSAAALYVPKTSSTSCHQAVLVDQASGAGLPSDAVPVEIDRFG